ncbi:MAG: hypothetical protein ABI380_11335 [Edaphobacter sp.]
MKIRLVAGALVCLLGVGGLSAQTVGSAKALVATMLTHEDYEAAHRGHYMYLSNERSERTGGHLWREKVVETTAGKVRMLVAEDGQLLSGDRLAAERAKLAEIAAHPDEFQRQQQTRKDDERHAKEMLDLLPKAFLLENERQDGQFVKIDFRPNPDYVPQSMEERVMHGMAGSMLVDSRAGRLHELEGRLPEDVNIGFGLLATIHAGSNFSTTRDPVPGDEWKTVVVDTDINGRAIFFKSIGKKDHSEHSEFKPVPQNLTVAQAVEMVEK